MAFFIQVLHDYEVKYSFFQKHVFVVVRSLKNFRYMLSNNRLQLLVAHPTVKDFLLNREINDKRASWVTKVMEFDVNIKVTKIVRGKELCEHLPANGKDSQEKEGNVETMFNNEEQVVGSAPTASWVQQMVHYLQTSECPQGLDREKRRYYRLQAIPYAIIDGVLYRRDFHGVLLRCIEPDQVDKLLEEFHNGPSGGHFAARTTTLKIMRDSTLR